MSTNFLLSVFWNSKRGQYGDPYPLTLSPLFPLSVVWKLNRAIQRPLPFNTKSTCLIRTFFVCRVRLERSSGSTP